MTKIKAVKAWQCMECGKKLTLKQAEKGECPKCGGADIDLAVPAGTPTWG